MHCQAICITHTFQAYNTITTSLLLFLYTTGTSSQKNVHTKVVTARQSSYWRRHQTQTASRKPYYYCHQFITTTYNQQQDISHRFSTQQPRHEIPASLGNPIQRNTLYFSYQFTDNNNTHHIEQRNSLAKSSTACTTGDGQDAPSCSILVTFACNLPTSVII